jgi:predicted ATPase
MNGNAMRIRIKKFSITNYRSCLNTSFEPHPDLSALIGKNASGKSSVLNGILLLKSLFNQGGRKLRSNLIRARSRINVELECEKKIIFLRADVYYTATETSRDEVFGGNVTWNLKNISGYDEWISFPFFFDPDMFGYSIEAMHDPAAFIHHEHFSRRYIRFAPDFEKKVKPFRKLFQPLYQFFVGISYYSASQFTDPTRCPVSIEIEDERLQRRGIRAADHTRFLHDLYRLWKSKSREYNEFLSIVGPGGLKLVDRIHFGDLDLPQSRYVVRVGGKVIREKSQRRLLIPYFQVDGRRLSPNQLSEGTFKTIALLFYLVIDKGSLLLIEEPEVCIHHGLLKSILTLVKSYSASKQIIISTHSDFVLDTLAPENVFLVRKEHGQGTKVKAVTKALSSRDFAALKVYLADTGNLGEFWRHGGLTHD